MNGRSCFLAGHEEWYTDCEDRVCAVCSGSRVESEMALARCGNRGSSCLSEDFAHEEDASLMSERARSDAAEETFTFVPQAPEDQSECCHVSTDFEEETVIKNTLLQVIRKEGTVQTACRLGTVVVDAGAYQRKYL